MDFQDLLSQQTDKQAIVFLKDVSFANLKALVNYMYRGEVNVSQEQLSTFLQTAEALKIKGYFIDRVFISIVTVYIFLWKSGLGDKENHNKWPIIPSVDSISHIARADYEPPSTNQIIQDKEENSPAIVEACQSSPEAVAAKQSDPHEQSFEDVKSENTSTELPVDQLESANTVTLWMNKVGITVHVL